MFTKCYNSLSEKRSSMAPTSGAALLMTWHSACDSLCSPRTFPPRPAALSDLKRMEIGLIVFARVIALGVFIKKMEVERGRREREDYVNKEELGAGHIVSSRNIPPSIDTLSI